MIQCLVFNKTLLQPNKVFLWCKNVLLGPKCLVEFETVPHTYVHTLFDAEELTPFAIHTYEEMNLYCFNFQYMAVHTYIHYHPAYTSTFIRTYTVPVTITLHPPLQCCQCLLLLGNGLLQLSLLLSCQATCLLRTSRLQGPHPLTLTLCLLQLL